MLSRKAHEAIAAFLCKFNTSELYDTGWSYSVCEADEIAADVEDDIAALQTMMVYIMGAARMAMLANTLHTVPWRIADCMYRMASMAHVLSRSAACDDDALVACLNAWETELRHEIGR